MDDIFELDLLEAVRPAFGSSAGKRHLASFLVRLIPDHQKYVEAFAGGGAVFFAKKPSPEEVINDRDREVAFAYRYLQGLTEAHIERLNKFDWVLRRGKWTAIKEGEIKPRNDDERLYFFYLLRGSFANSCRSFAGESRLGKSIKPNLNRLMRVKERLAGVQISAQDFSRVLLEHDSPQTFFFLDPPYPGTAKGWDVEFDFEHFREMVGKLKGKFLMTLNDTPEHRRLFSRYHVKRVSVMRTMQKTTQQDDPDSRPTAPELIVTNYTPHKTDNWRESAFLEGPEITEDALGEAVDPFTSKLWRYFVPGQQGAFVALIHVQGLTEKQVADRVIPEGVTAHLDLLFDAGEGSLIGTELALGNLSGDQLTALLEKKSGKRFLVPSLKPVHSLSFLSMGMGAQTDWLHVRQTCGDVISRVQIGNLITTSDVIPPGEFGATKNTWAKYLYFDAGAFTAGTQDQQFKEFWLSGSGKHFDGRWIFIYVPKGDSGERMWIAQRPEDHGMKSPLLTKSKIALAETFGFPALVTYGDGKYVLRRTSGEKLLLTKA